MYPAVFSVMQVLIEKMHRIGICRFLKQQMLPYVWWETKKEMFRMTTTHPYEDLSTVKIFPYNFCKISII